jgi:hypothetical protein
MWLSSDESDQGWDDLFTPMKGVSRAVQSVAYDDDTNLMF